MHKLFNTKKILFLAGCLLLVAPLAHAQLTSAVPAPVQYVVTPPIPGPNQQVQIEVQGVGSFIGDSTITWSQGGKVVQSGVGSRDYTFTTGAIGIKTAIHVSIVSSQGTFTNDFTFLPSSVNLIWEADTTAPPFYRGKPLYSAGSGLTVVAFPTVIESGTRVSVSKLSFQWSVDGNTVPEQSGLGQNVFTFTGDQLQSSESVDVAVYAGTSEVGESSVTIPATTPQLLLYDKDPLRGVLWDEALPSALSLASNELTIQAVPYFFSNDSLNNGSLEYAWTLGGSDITGPSSAQGILTLRQTGSGTGSAQLGVSLQDNDTSKLVQAANAALQIVFGQQSNTSLFGL